jgi:hypothetical protein
LSFVLTKGEDYFVKNQRRKMKLVAVQNQKPKTSFKACITKGEISRPLRATLNLANKELAKLSSGSTLTISQMENLPNWVSYEAKNGFLNRLLYGQHHVKKEAMGVNFAAIMSNVVGVMAALAVKNR